MDTYLCLLTDSQGYEIEGSEYLEVRAWGGAKVHFTKRLVDQGDISRFEDVAIWLGGNNAHPLSGRKFDETRFKVDLHNAVAYVRAVNPRARIALVTATRRIAPARWENVKKVNELIHLVAWEEKVIFVNLYKVLEKHFKRPEDYIESRHGVHISYEAKGRAILCIRQNLRLGQVARNPPPPPAALIEVRGRMDILSMFYGARLFYKGHWFETAEHAYQHQKCIDAKLFSKAAEIAPSSNPFEAKRLGVEANKLLSEDDRLQLLDNVVSERWQQQAAFKQALIGTGTSRIVHTVNDKLWGHLDGAGQNAYGKALMKARHNLP